MRDVITEAKVGGVGGQELKNVGSLELGKSRKQILS